MHNARFETLETGSITSPQDFEAAGVAAGLKPTGAPDLALVYSRRPCTAAAVFTQNAFPAAPVLYDRDLLAQNPGGLRAVAVNSGCANACTGERGLADARAMAASAAEVLGIGAGEVAVMSTGVIGQYLPLERIRAGLARAAAERSADVDAGHLAARAIMTTDTRSKEVAVRVDLGDATCTIAGMAKGAGMISPNMATLLCVVTSDARIAPAAARAALVSAVEEGFNLITVDGDMSTNDTALLMANGAAGNASIEHAEGPAFEAFCEGLTHVVVELAKAIARDGEGAAHLIEIAVTGARTRAEARQVGMSIAKSPLVKTAIYGHDANWGRVLCAAGYSGVAIDPARVTAWLGDLEVYRHGDPQPFDEVRARALLEAEDVSLRVDLGAGDAAVTVWTCDLTHSYVDINAHYRT